MEGMIRKTDDMERLILEAYDDALTNDLFAITTMLECLINRRYSRNDPRGEITTGQVRYVLESRDMNYTLGRNHQPANDASYPANHHHSRRVMAVFR